VVILQVLADSAIKLDNGLPIGLETIPMSPRRLRHYAEVARNLAGTVPRAAAGLRSSRPLALVVDESEISCTMTTYALEALGCRCVAASCAEAFELCKQLTPQCLLINMLRPSMANSLVGRLRRAVELGELPRIPVISMIGGAIGGAVGAAPEGRAGDVDAFIVKPWHIGDLDQALQQVGARA
jgi:CheY-like chemotaxis protein